MVDLIEDGPLMKDQISLVLWLLKKVLIKNNGPPGFACGNVFLNLQPPKANRDPKPTKLLLSP